MAIERARRKALLLLTTVALALWNLVSILVLGADEGEPEDRGENTSNTVGDTFEKQPPLQPWQEGYGRERKGRLARRFIVFEAAPENERDRGMQKRKMVSSIYI